MKILHIDEKWSVRYDPDNNDLPVEWLRYGETHRPFSDSNAALAMFYALLSERAA